MPAKRLTDAFVRTVKPPREGEDRQVRYIDTLERGLALVLMVSYGGTKAFVLALTHSLVHELGDKGVRVQAVLPGATATEFWDVAGKPVHQLPAQIVMSVDDLVDAALVGLDLGETVTIPSLADGAEWDRYEAARRAMSGRISTAIPAPRYNLPRRERLTARSKQPAA